MKIGAHFIGCVAASLFCLFPAHGSDNAPTGILGFASASYSCPKAPLLEDGGIGIALSSVPDGLPYRSLAYAATRSPKIEKRGLVVAVSDFCYAGSYSGEIPAFGWRSVDQQISNLFERWPQLYDPSYPGPKYVVLGPFNNGLHTAGAHPELDDHPALNDPSALLFSDEDGNWTNTDGRNLHFDRIDAAIYRLLDAGVYPVVMGYPDPDLVDLDYWLSIFQLPPWTQVATRAGFTAISEYNRQRYEGRVTEGILYVPTDNIQAQDIGDGFHLEYKYHKKSAKALAKAIKEHQEMLHGTSH